MNTLELQRSKLEEELRDATLQIEELKSRTFPDFKLINYYTDTIRRNRKLIEMIDTHRGFWQQKSENDNSE